ncbi:MAG: acyl carrier protein [Oscillospiraceae bacterium]|nr:acyl carrier protein [Oscillospiraceae bacterium]MCD7792846.1 acyl carrier protein [Oscillospiraceae bacterium]MCD8017282.1 acyl carrier protein [Oscillospiraceae bacterium]MCD8100260.1 acyl carrier protein [Oscillospiraceae bacterium]MCD8192881.1 acyl carrier protein [Oscillospiraceae bacterium]
MDTAEVFVRLRDILADVLEANPAAVTMETNIVDDLGADSLDIVEIITGLEEEFDLTITDESVQNLYTAGEIAEYIANLLT